MWLIQLYHSAGQEAPSLLFCRGTGSEIADAKEVNTKVVRFVDSMHVLEVRERIRPMFP